VSRWVSTPMTASINSAKAVTRTTFPRQRGIGRGGTTRWQNCDESRQDQPGGQAAYQANKADRPAQRCRRHVIGKARRPSRRPVCQRVIPHRRTAWQRPPSRPQSLTVCQGSILVAGLGAALGLVGCRRGPGK
jgi:hypothetical protein